MLLEDLDSAAYTSDVVMKTIVSHLPAQEVPACEKLKMSGAFKAMDGLLQVELSPQERDVLLRGLRYVRSAIMLEMRDPVPDDEARRSIMLDEIQILAQRLQSTDPMGIRI